MTDEDNMSTSQEPMLFQQSELALFEDAGIVPEEDERKYRSFLPSPFIAASLPLRFVKSSKFTRKYNDMSLTLSSADYLPYGRYGRLLLTILTTHAVLSKNSNQSGGVEVYYDKLSQLLEEMDLPRSRGDKVKDQLENFSKTSFLFEGRVSKVTQKSLFKDAYDEGEDLNGKVTVTQISTGNIRFMSGFQYIQLDDGENKKNVSFKIVLSDEFVKFSKEHAVPIDYSAYKEIGSDVGKDLYAWFIYRNNAIKEPLFIPRQLLIDQFMPVTDEAKKNNEKANYAYIIDQIKLIKEKYYKELNVSISEDGTGITLYKSPVPIMADETRYVLITSNL
ncbi:MAG: replication protein RepA [Treponema sp.]|nr:replication protein RepA [Treponema sp.]